MNTNWHVLRLVHIGIVLFVKLVGLKINQLDLKTGPSPSTQNNENGPENIRDVRT